MATNTKTTKPAPIEGAPASWGDVPLLAGLSLIEKDELVGRPFLVRAVENSLAAEGYPRVRVEIEFIDGTAVMFQDSSGTSGVRPEIEELLTKRGKGEEALMDEWIQIKFICPDGLRVSPYEKPDNRGVMRKGRTFYLTRSGQRDDA